MKSFRKSYYNNQWYEFSKSIHHRDNYKCLKCGRGANEVVLQTHHKIYKPNLKPWEYAKSDCLTLCKGCHAREHNLIEPTSGWILISIDDLGGLDGVCEKIGCGNEIRYEHLTYHPKWGYKIVGSTCVEYLTSDDQFLSKKVLAFFNQVSNFVSKYTWEESKTKKGVKFIYTNYKKNEIRIYGNYDLYAVQIALKLKGIRKLEFQKTIKLHNKPIEQVKEMSFIILKGLITEKENEKEFLRDIYRRIR